MNFTVAKFIVQVDSVGFKNFVILNYFLVNYIIIKINIYKIKLKL